MWENVFSKVSSKTMNENEEEKRHLMCWGGEWVALSTIVLYILDIISCSVIVFVRLCFSEVFFTLIRLSVQFLLFNFFRVLFGANSASHSSMKKTDTSNKKKRNETNCRRCEERQISIYQRDFYFAPMIIWSLWGSTRIASKFSSPSW